LLLPRLLDSAPLGAYQPPPVHFPTSAPLFVSQTHAHDPCAPRSTSTGFLVLCSDNLLSFLIRHPLHSFAAWLMFSSCQSCELMILIASLFLCNIWGVDAMRVSDGNFTSDAR
jgi:hypothetical protein